MGKKTKSEGQSNFSPRKRLNQAFRRESPKEGGIPVRGSFFAVRNEENVEKGKNFTYTRGFFLGYEIMLDNIVVQYHTEGLESKELGLPRELPRHVLYEGEPRNIVYKKVTKPTYEPEKKD